MADFPVVLTNAVDGDPPVGTEIVAKHLNNLEAKVGIDNSAVVTSLDYLLKNAASIEPGHKHSKLWASDGSVQAVFVDAAGKVGIGAVPATLFHVTGNVAGQVQLTLENLSADAAARTRFLLKQAGNERALWYTNGTEVYLQSIGTTVDFGFTSQRSFHFNASASSSGSFYFRHGATVVLFITTAGEVGIGTTSNLDQKLNVNGSISLGRNAQVVSTHFIGNVDFAGAINGGSGMFLESDANGMVDVRFQSNNWGVGYGSMILKANGNVGIGTTIFGTSAAKVLGIGTGTAPTTAPADLAQMWVQDINGAAGYAGLHKLTETTNVVEIIPGVVIKGTTGQTANPYEGLMEINTFDNTVKIYADGGWRTIASGW